jgi:perosamine synthetase
MGPILALAEKHGLPVIEDAAEAHLAQYDGKHAGTMGRIGIFSFTPTKPMTTGEGGMIVTNDAELADELRLIRNFGDKSKFDWVTLGFNFRMMDIQGAIGLQQLQKLRDSVRIRREIAGRYTEALERVPGIVTPFVRRIEDINFQLYTIRLEPTKFTIDRDRFIDELISRGVAARLYYPALHRAPVFARFGPGSDRDFPVTSAFADSALSLPLFPDMTEEEIEHVIASVGGVAEEHSAE